jgi:Kinesin motor domain
MLADIFADDPECANKSKQPTNTARTIAFAGSRLDDELELKKLQVFVRIRPPFTEGTPRWGAENCIHASSRHGLAIAPPETSLAYKNGDRGQTYSFTRVFDDSTSQEDYYNGTAAPIVADLLRDPTHNSVMMAYGITAAGKTYTLEGTKSQPGVVSRALTDIFGGLTHHVDGASLYIAVSYFEVCFFLLRSLSYHIAGQYHLQHLTYAKAMLNKY